DEVDSVGVFFFQAEDGIRDFHVTGVQTCALPICGKDRPPSSRFHRREAEETEKQRGRGDREAEWRWHGWMAVSCPRTGIVPVGRRPNELLFRFDASYAKILGLQYPVMDELISPMKQAA